MPMTGFQEMAYARFKRWADPYAKNHKDMDTHLMRSAMGLTAPAYYSYVWMCTMIAVAGGILFCLVFISATFLLGFLWVGYLIAAAGLIIIPLATYFGLLNWPKWKAGSRARRMDAQLPYAVNFVAAMAAANATPQKIFRSLALQENIYHDIAIDAGEIYRDTAVLGIDMVSALKRAVKRAPSDKYKEFLQGVINTLTSGGAMKYYFRTKAEHYMRVNRQEQEEFLETLSFLAESYVVIAVAMPIFAMIIMVIMSWMSSAAMANMVDIGLVAGIFVGLPLIHAAYLFAVSAMTPEG